MIKDKRLGFFHLFALLAVVFLLQACAGRTFSVPKSLDDNNNCASESHNDSFRKHLIIVNRLGEVKEGLLPDKANESYANQFTRIMCAYSAFRKERELQNKGSGDRILLYVNGGLNNEKLVINQAKEQIQQMKEDGYFPIFLVWNTGALETYGEQVGRVRNGRLHQSMQWATLPFYVISDILMGIARAPVTYYNQGLRSADAGVLPPKEYKVGTLGDGLTYKENDVVSSANNWLIEKGVNDEVPKDWAGNSRYFIASPVRLVSTLFTDSFGKTAWQNMVRRTRTVLNKPAEFQSELLASDDSDNPRASNNNTQKKREPTYTKGTGGFAKFFQDLEWCINGDPSCRLKGMQGDLKSARLTVVGHSMGTIVLNELIARFPDLPYENIVYMAAACSVREAARSLEPVLAGAANRPVRPHFYNLMLHPLADAREYSGWGLLPSGSLLEWIDDMYEEPKTNTDRTFGKFRNVRLTKRIFSDKAQSRMLFKVFGFRSAGDNGRNYKDPTTHGEFNDGQMKFWRPDFWGGDKVRWDDPSP